MSDFFQSGVVATFHRLKNPDLETLEADLIEFSQNKGITLVLPSLFSELYGPGLKIITEELKKVKYLQEIVVTLGPTTNEQFPVIKEYFAQLPQKVNLIWNNGSRIKTLPALKVIGD